MLFWQNAIKNLNAFGVQYGNNPNRNKALSRFNHTKARWAQSHFCNPMAASWCSLQNCFSIRIYSMRSGESYPQGFDFFGSEDTGRLFCLSGRLSGSSGYKLVGYKSLLQSCPMLISLDVSVFRINCVSADTGAHRNCVCVPTHLHVNGVLQGFSLIFKNRKAWLIEIYLKRVYLPLGLGTIDCNS